MNSLHGLPLGAPTATDAQLFADAVADPSVLAGVFDRHASTLLCYLTRRLGPDAAEDVLGDVLVVVIERRGSFRPEAASALPWLYGIASNLIHRHARDERKHLLALRNGRHELSQFEDGVAARLDAEDDVNGLAGALARLAAGDRDVLLLTAWADLDQAEVATALGIPVGTVKSRLHRARKQLRAASWNEPGTAFDAISTPSAQTSRKDNR